MTATMVITFAAWAALGAIASPSRSWQVSFRDHAFQLSSSSRARPSAPTMNLDHPCHTITLGDLQKSGATVIYDAKSLCGYFGPIRPKRLKRRVRGPDTRPTLRGVKAASGRNIRGKNHIPPIVTLATFGGVFLSNQSGRLDSVRSFSRRRPELDRRGHQKVRLPFPSNPPGP